MSAGCPHRQCLKGILEHARDKSKCKSPLAVITCTCYKCKAPTTRKCGNKHDKINTRVYDIMESLLCTTNGDGVVVISNALI